MQSKRAAFVVGHEHWGKTRTLRALMQICAGEGRRVTIGDQEFFVRATSNDDRPKHYREFMTSTEWSYLVAALCPKFKKLSNFDNPRKEADEVLQGLQQRGYRLFFWVIEHKWSAPSRVVEPNEINELRRYGTVEIFAGQRVEAEQRAREFRDFVMNVALST